MTPDTATPLPTTALCEMLLRQSAGCAWLLNRDAAFHAVYGDAQRVFGRSAAELEGRHFADAIGPPGRPAWMRRLERVFAGETLGATGQFGDGAQFFISMFPVRPAEGEIAFAGGLAHEMPEAGILVRALEDLNAHRTRLSQLLHDFVGQNLSVAGLQLDLLRMDLAESALPIPQRVGEIQAMLETVMEMVREVNRELNPAVAERLGLRAALDRLAGRLRADFKGNVRVFADATAQPPPESAAALYRIAEEAANRAARRTGCSAIEILLKSLRSGPALEIRDNGIGIDGGGGSDGGCGGGSDGGCDGGCHEGGLEFVVMRHFAERAGIELRIDSARGGGTVIRALCRAAVPRA
jgi:signal transduction histidine kinase